MSQNNSASSTIETCRLVLKNLPRSVVEADIYKVCSEAKLTRPSDVKLYPDRRFCFLGFKESADANKALSALDQIYLLNCRVRAEACRPLAEPSSEEVEAAEKEIMETGRLFVRNIHYTVSEEEFKALFEPHGGLDEVILCWDKQQQRNKGFGHVSYVFPTDAIKAFKALNKSVLNGRNLHVCAGKDKPEDNRQMSFKEERDAKLKRNASKGHNWNALFLGSDAVAEVMSSQLGIGKDQLLQPSARAEAKGSSVAVVQAMAETELVQQTRDYLERAGLRLSVIQDHCARPIAQRSTCTFMAKNLPPGTTSAELRERFEPYGALRRLILPPSGITAVLEFKVAQEAKQAYRKQAYNRIKDRPLLLEWAPENLLDPDAPELSVATNAAVDENESVATTPVVDAANEDEDMLQKEEEVKAEEEEKEEQEEDAATKRGNKLLVRNVAFQATRAELSALFRPFGECRVRLPVKAAAGVEEGGHRGFAFVEFALRKCAERALQQLGVSTHLYGRRLVLELAAQGEEAMSEAKSAANRRKKERGALESELAERKDQAAAQSGKRLRRAMRDRREEQGAVS